MKRVWPFVVFAFVSIGAGIVTFFAPALTAIALLALVATWSFVRGVLDLIAAVRLRQQLKREWLLALSGLLSIVVGVLLVLQPVAGLVALVWLLGIYAIALGALYVILGVRLGREEKAGHLPTAHAV
jgi:uncharacterized membrane protein HdeD (DUF308 family)